jgi:hypothetical protein
MVLAKNYLRFLTLTVILNCSVKIVRLWNHTVYSLVLDRYFRAKLGHFAMANHFRLLALTVVWNCCEKYMVPAGSWISGRLWPWARSRPTTTWPMLMWRPFHPLLTHPASSCTPQVLYSIGTVVEFFIKVRTLVRTFSGHGVQQYVKSTKKWMEGTYRQHIGRCKTLLLCYVLNPLFLHFKTATA